MDTFIVKDRTVKPFTKSCHPAVAVVFIAVGDHAVWWFEIMHLLPRIRTSKAPTMGSAALEANCFDTKILLRE